MMHIQISTKEKHDFIQWFLNEYQLKRRESEWILSYLMNEQKLLPFIHFVRDIQYCPRAIAISTKCSTEPAFYFYKDHIITDDADKSFHDIRLNNHENLYIQLNFPKANQNPHYATVLEENPYSFDEPTVKAKDQWLAKEMLDKSIKDHQVDMLKTQIDEALRQYDQQRFLCLVNKLNKIK